MNNKKDSLAETKDLLKYAMKNLEYIKAQDIKARKLAKPSQKAKWTKSIVTTSLTIDYLRYVKGLVKDIPLRV